MFVSVLPDHFKVSKGRRILTSPVLVCVSHDEKISTGVFPFPLRTYNFRLVSNDS